MAQVQYRHELAHARDNRYLGFLYFRLQVYIEGFDRCVVSDRYECRHVQHSSYLAASTTDKSLASLRSLWRISIGHWCVNTFVWHA